MNSLNSFRKLVSNKSFGIEIECCVTTEGDDIAQEHKHLGFFYVTQDWSISREFGSVFRHPKEFVSQPMPAEWLGKEIHKLWNKVGGWESNRTCGIHVHVNRKWCTTNKAKAIYAALQQLSGEQMRELFGRSPNRYCSISQKITEGRYSSVNIQNTNTIEFRMFASGDHKWAAYCVNMTKFMVENYNTLNYEQLLAARDMLTHNY